MKHIAVSAVVTGLWAVSAGADTIVVAVDGSGDFTDIQSGIDAAVDGDEVLVMPGVYLGSDVAGMLNPHGKVITIRSDAGPEETILDGQTVGRGIVIQGGETLETLIEGFTIQNCFAWPTDLDGNGTIDWWDQCGGGLAMIYGDCTIVNCRFIGNSADGNGGAIGLLAYSDLVLTDCLLEENYSAWDGGGVFTTTWSPMNATDCTFLNNTASGNGGAVKGGGSGALTFTGCMVQGNSAGSVGGLFLGGCPTSLSFTTVCGNSGEQIGSGDWDDAIGNLVLDICPEIGACCTTLCVEQATEADCERFGGTWYGTGSTCADITCEGGGGSNCPADIDGSGEVGVDDLLTLLSEYGSVCP